MRGIGVAVITSTCGESAFFDQAFALQNSESVLLIDDNEAEFFEFDGFFDQRVSAGDELRFAGADAFERGELVGAFHAANEQLDAVVSRREGAARGKIVLHGENFCGRHQCDLVAVLDGNNRGFERDDGFAAADVAFEQAIHRRRAFQIAGDFGEDAFLRGGGLEGKDAFHRLADLVVADAQGNPSSRALFLAARGDPQLEEEKFFEDHAYVRGAAKAVEQLETFTRGGKWTYIKASRRDGKA